LFFFTNNQAAFITKVLIARQTIFRWLNKV